jgi:hypothetical protein
MSLTRTVRIWYKRNFSPSVRNIIYQATILGLIVTVEIFLIFIAATLTSLRLIDWTIVVSFFVVELLAAIVARMLGVGRESEEEASYRRLHLASLKEGLVPKYGHLEIVCLKGEDEEYPEYPKSVYYVINSDKQCAYWADRFLCDLMREGVMRREIFGNSTLLEAYLAKGGYTIEKRYPERDELQEMPPLPDVTPI